ncbi:hypothetical protein CP09DC79_1097A, partial [Chlamydia psittaci 09DC79]
MWHP